MSNAYPKPKWWRLYAVLPLALALFVLESQLALPDVGHKLVQIGIVLFVVGLIGLWLTANARALELQDEYDVRFAALRDAQLRQQLAASIQSLQAERPDSASARVNRLPLASESLSREGRNN